MNYIATNISTLRKEARLSIEELGSIIGVDSAIIIEWEKGISLPDSAILPILCKTIRISVEDFQTRDIALERNEALKAMKNGPHRKNFNWYFGDRQKVLFYLGFLIGIPLVYLFCYFIAKWQILPNFFVLEYYMEENDSFEFIANYLTYINAYYYLSNLVGILVIIYLAFRLHYRFVWWHIFLISFVIGMIPLIGMIATIPFYGYCFWQVAVKRGKN